MLSVLNQRMSVISIERHHNVPEVSSVNLPAFRKLVGHIATELWILNHGRPKVLDTELIVLRYVDPLNITQIEKRFLFLQDLPEEILVYTDLRRAVELPKVRVSEC